MADASQGLLACVVACTPLVARAVPGISPFGVAARGIPQDAPAFPEIGNSANQDFDVYAQFC